MRSTEHCSYTITLYPEIIFCSSGQLSQMKKQANGIYCVPVEITGNSVTVFHRSGNSSKDSLVVCLQNLSWMG